MKVVVVLETVLNIIVNEVDSTRAMLWAKAVGRRFHGIPGNHDLGGCRVEDTFLAPQGADMLGGGGGGNRKDIGKSSLSRFEAKVIDNLVGWITFTGDPLFFVTGVTVVLVRGEVSKRDMIRVRL